MTTESIQVKAHPSLLQIIVQGACKRVAQVFALSTLVVSNFFAGGPSGMDFDPGVEVVPKRDCGKVYLKRKFGRAFIRDAKRGGAWRLLLSHYFKLGGTPQQYLLVSRSGWVAIVVEVMRIRKVFGLEIHDLKVESPNGWSYVSLVTSESAET